MRVLYVTCDEFPHSSVAVMVITAVQVPEVDAANTMAPDAEQLSVAVVAASAAASAEATSG